MLWGFKPGLLLGVHWLNTRHFHGNTLTPHPTSTKWLITVSALSRLLFSGGCSSAAQRKRRSSRRWGRSAATSLLLWRSSRPSRRKTRASPPSSRYRLLDHTQLYLAHFTAYSQESKEQRVCVFLVLEVKCSLSRRLAPHSQEFTLIQLCTYAVSPALNLYFLSLLLSRKHRVTDSVAGCSLRTSFL